MSNLIKSGFVAFSQDKTIVVDANQNKIIQAIDSSIQQIAASEESSMEEALAEALIRDAELEGMDFGEDTLTMDTADLPDLSHVSDEFAHVADEITRSARDEAESILNQAHDEAEQLRAEAYDEAEAIRNKAQEEGYQSGYQEGLSVAQETYQRKTEELEARQLELETTFQEREQQLVTEVENQMVDLLCQLIPSITGVVVEDQRNVLLYMINSAMQDLDNCKNFVIRVSSDDYEDLEENKDSIYGALNPNITVEIYEDVKLSKLQCQIETENGIVDLSLDVQLDNLLTAMKLLTKV